MVGCDKFVGPFCVNEIYCGDALELLKKVPSRSIDLIIADPPFGINFEGRRGNYNRKKENVLPAYNEIPKEEYLDFSRRWISEAYRVLKDSGSIYVFSGWTNLKDILIAIDDAGFITINHLIWKYQFGVYTRRRFVTSHYHIIFAVKDVRKYKFNKIEHYPEDVIIMKRDYWRGVKKPPTRLPVDLVKKFILFSSDEEDIVLDPFMGSGTTAVACVLTNRYYIGFEIVPELVEFARNRVREVKFSLKNDVGFR